MILGGFMFGYFKLDKECPTKLFSQYKKYYCFLCRTLGKHYGVAARFTLSYDIAFLAMLVTDASLLKEINKIHCLKFENSLSELLDKEVAKKIASVNVLLATAKLEDDILDENSIKAKMIYFLLSSAIRKAKKSNPDMWEIISNGYTNIRVLEKDNQTLETLENSFADIMCNVAKECFEINNGQKLSLLKAISKWLYFIDAIDDLDENIAEGTFNPFLEYKSFKNLKLNYKKGIIEHYYSLFKDVNLSKNTSEINEDVINRVVFWGIPEMTVKVLTKGCDEK